MNKQSDRKINLCLWQQHSLEINMSQCPKRVQDQKTGYPLCLDKPEACGMQFPITQHYLDRTTMSINDFRKLRYKLLKQEVKP